MWLFRININNLFGKIKFCKFLWYWYKLSVINLSVKLLDLFVMMELIWEFIFGGIDILVELV